MQLFFLDIRNSDIGNWNLDASRIVQIHGNKHGIFGYGAIRSNRNRRFHYINRLFCVLLYR